MKTDVYMHLRQVVCSAVTNLIDLHTSFFFDVQMLNAYTLYKCSIKCSISIYYNLNLHSIGFVLHGLTGTMVL